MEYDVVVVGGGAAGLSAALVLARARRRVAVVDAGEARNASVKRMRGFLSRDGMSPAHLLAAGRGELVGYGGEVIRGRVLGIEHGFVVRLAERALRGVQAGDRVEVEHSPGARELTARGVLVATGLRDELPDVPGLRERWGIDVLHCPYCHGYEVRDAPIGILGGHMRELSVHQAFLIRQWSRDVVFFPNRIALTTDERERLTAHGIRIIDGEVARLAAEDNRLSGVELADGQLVSRAAVFVGPRFVPQDELLTNLGCAVGENGWVVTDATGRTSVTGVWAAGNVVDPRAQVITAAGAGSAAAIALNSYLLEDDIKQSLADHDTAGIEPVFATENHDEYPDRSSRVG